MRRPLLASGLLLVLFAAAGPAVIAQPRRPQRPPTGDAATHTDASSDGAAAPQATDAAAVADASLASSADVAVTAATLEDGGVLVGDAAIPMRQVGTGTVIHFPVPEQLARTAVPVFVQIRSSAPIDHVSLFFRGVGARRYTEVRMSALGQQFRLPAGYGALIPCDDIFPPRVE